MQTEVSLRKHRVQRSEVPAERLVLFTEHHNSRYIMQAEVSLRKHRVQRSEVRAERLVFLAKDNRHT